MNFLDEEIENFIRDRFEGNFVYIQEETGTGLAPDIKEMALKQVLYYWRKLKAIATKVTETEVRLNLPCQRTPKGREFSIEGVVDIVREGGETVMYDIKTHDPDYVRSHKENYSNQLNIYAYIWQILRGQELDQAAVIATSFPEAMREAITNDDEIKIQKEMEQWEPVIEIPFDANAVQESIREFGEVVDAIEDGEFGPPEVETLMERKEDTGSTFARHVCRNCDARFSCQSYRLFMKKHGGSKAEMVFEHILDEGRADWEQEDQIDILLDAQEESVILEEMMI